MEQGGVEQGGVVDDEEKKFSDIDNDELERVLLQSDLPSGTRVVPLSTSEGKLDVGELEESLLLSYEKDDDLQFEEAPILKTTDDMFAPVPVEDLTIENLNIGYLNRAILYNSYNFTTALTIALDGFYETMKTIPEIKQLTKGYSPKLMLNFRSEITLRLLLSTCRIVYDSWDDFTAKLTSELLHNPASTISSRMDWKSFDAGHNSNRHNGMVLVDLLQKLVANVVITIQQNPELGPKEAVDISSFYRYKYGITSNISSVTAELIIRKGERSYMLFDYYSKDLEKCLKDQSSCITTRLLQGFFTSWENMQTLLKLSDIELRNIRYAITNYEKITNLALRRLNDILLRKYFYLSQIVLEGVMAESIDVTQLFYIWNLQSKSFSSWDDVINALQKVNLNTYIEFLDIYPMLKGKEPNFGDEQEINTDLLLRSFVFDANESTTTVVCELNPTIRFINMPNSDEIDIKLLDAMSVLIETAEIIVDNDIISKAFQKVLFFKKYKTWDEVAKALKLNSEQMIQIKDTLSNIYEAYYFSEENSTTRQESRPIEKLKGIILYQPQLLESIITNEQMQLLITRDYATWSEVENILSMNRESLEIVKLKKLIAQTDDTALTTFQAEINKDASIQASKAKFPTEWDFATISSIHDTPLPNLLDYKYYVLWLENGKPNFVEPEKETWWNRGKNMSSFSSWKDSNAWYKGETLTITNIENIRGHGYSGENTVLSEDELNYSKQFLDTLKKLWTDIPEPKLSFDDFMILHRDLNVIDRGRGYRPALWGFGYTQESDDMKNASDRLWYEWVAKGKPLLEIEAKNYSSTIRMDENGLPFSQLTSSLSDSKIKKAYNKAFNKWVATIPQNQDFVREKQEVLSYIHVPFKTIYDSIPNTSLMMNLSEWIDYIRDYFELTNTPERTSDQEKRFTRMHRQMQAWYNRLPRDPTASYQRPPEFSYKRQSSFFQFSLPSSASILNPERDATDEPDWLETLQILLNIFTLQYNRYISWIDARLLYAESPGANGSTDQNFDQYNDEKRYGEIVKFEWNEAYKLELEEYANLSSWNISNMFKSRPQQVSEEEYYRNNIERIRTQYEQVDTMLLERWQDLPDPKPDFKVWRREELISSNYSPENPFLTETVDAVKYLEEVINKDRLPRIEQTARVTPFAITMKTGSDQVIATINNDQLRCLGLTSRA